MLAAMAENQFLSVIRTWAAMAWADGVVVAAEALAMRKLIESAELTAADRTTAMGFLDTKVELDTTNLAALSVDARKGVYKAACRLAAVDRDLAEPEKAAAAAEIETSVFGAPKVG
jgi:hypothetical protein